jgi:hypothetical protein|nr:MAG TPA: hypothetical protein [Caudoviricetes sp.]
MTNEEQSMVGLLLHDFETRFNNHIECLPKYYDRTKSIDNRLRQVEDVVSKRKYNNLLIVINVFFWIVIFDTIAILYLLFS